MKQLLVRFGRDEAGVTAIEYGLIAALVAVALITVITGMKTAMATMFGKVTTALG